VHERVGVNQLDCSRQGIEHLFRRADELAARVDEQRTDALAAAEDRVAHRVEQSLWDLVIGTENVGELLVDSAAVMVETLRERLWRGPCYHREPS
jgi:hypothetical protein